MRKLLLVLSLVLISLSGCYMRGHDDMSRRGHDQHEENSQDDHKGDHSGEHNDRDK